MLKDRFLLLAMLSLVVLAPSAAAQITGVVKDAETREVLPGATVTVEGRPGGVLADRYGRFVVSVIDSATVVVRFVGYVPARVLVGPRMRGPLEVVLVAATDSIEATVTASAVGASVAGTTVLTAHEVARVPALLGEADALRVLQLLPGVVQGAEGSTGLHVRGGSPDQTLLLLDGATVYNAAHLFGGVSVFNPDVLQSLRLVKSGLPAREGGRLGSVLDVTTREGRRDRRAARGSVGLLASRLAVDGPLAAGRGAFLVSARRTYADMLVYPLVHDWGKNSTNDIGYAFTDATAKVNLDVGARTRLFASAYAGRDRYAAEQSEKFDRHDDGTFGYTKASADGLSWGNLTGTLRATHVVTPRLFLSALGAYSRYGFTVRRESSRIFNPLLGATDRVYAFEQSSGLREWTARLDADWSAGRGHAVQAGVAVGDRDFRPVRLVRTARDETGTLDASAEAVVQTANAAAYVEDTVHLSPRLLVVGGFRVDVHRAEGRTWAGPQPRARIELEAGRGWRVSASAERLWQPLHLLSNAGVGLPTDLWVPATPRVPPASGEGVAAGVAHAWRGWDVSADAYVRRLRGLVEYRDAQGSLPSGARWEADIVRGDGAAAGLELLARRSEGHMQGWIGYALSRARRSSPEIDGGRPFPYRFDRTHQLTAALNHQITRRRTVGMSTIVATGLAATLPVGTYGFGGYDLQYTARNAGRFPAYLRLDVSYSIDYGRGTLGFGVYNVTNRLNTFTMRVDSEFEVDPATGEPAERYQLKSLSLFPALPYVSYQFAL